MAASPCCSATWPKKVVLLKQRVSMTITLTFTGPARIFESQDAAVTAILTDPD